MCLAPAGWRQLPSARSRVRSYDVTADAKHVVGIISATIQPGNVARLPNIGALVNWFEELRERAPTK